MTFLNNLEIIRFNEFSKHCYALIMRYRTQQLLFKQSIIDREPHFRGPRNRFIAVGKFVLLYFAMHKLDPIYVQLIFAIFQFEIVSSLLNLIFSLLQT